MNDFFNKPEKAGTKQQLRSRITLLKDELSRIEEERLNILGDIIKLEHQLSKMDKEDV